MDEMGAPTDQRLQRQWIFRRPDVFTVHKLCLEKTRLPLRIHLQTSIWETPRNTIR